MRFWRSRRAKRRSCWWNLKQIGGNLSSAKNVASEQELSYYSGIDTTPFPPQIHEGMSPEAQSAAWDFIGGILGLVYTFLKIEAAIKVAIVTAPFGITPQWVKDTGKEVIGGLQGIAEILKNPGRALASLGQQVTDTVEEKGIPYAVSYVLADAAISILVDKEIGKLRGVDQADDVAGVGGLEGGSKINYEIISSSTADEVNAIFKESLGYEPPYKPGTSVTEIRLTENTTYVRVYDKTNSRMQGGWVMKAEDIVGLTPQEIQNKFALPNTPIYICDVELEAGTLLRTGEVNPLFGFEGGGQQYDLIINGKNVGVFCNERIIGQ